MITSARNTIYGTINAINKGAINSEISLDIGEQNLSVIITNESVVAMDCKLGEEAYALIKSSAIILSKEKPYRISARNILKLKVSDVKVGAVNVEVLMQSSNNNTIVAQVTEESSEKLDIKIGDEIFAIIKASQVILGMSS